MKKFLLFVFAGVLSLTIKAQTYEEFNNNVLPAGWDLASGMQVSPYNKPDNSCLADNGLETPGVGGNNPARILTAASTYATGYNNGKIDVGFLIYVFDSNLKCTSLKPLPCTTYVTVYLVKESVTTATIPTDPTLILYKSNVQLVQGNAVNVIDLDLLNPLAPYAPFTTGQRYRVLYDFSVTGNCNQNGTKYILDKFLIPGTNASLPVTLINFNAAQKSNKVSLSWETTFEQNNKGFEVERRIGNGTYEQIAFVPSKEIAGNGGGNSYSFEDNTVLSKGVSYYRLRQVDYDGRVAFSEVKAIRTGNGSIVLSVYPNPSRGTTNVAIPAGVGSVDVSVDDFTGKSVQRFSGLTTQNLQLTNLKPGMYMLRLSIRATGETITERIAVQ
jgi:hypothetical protein